MPNSYHNHYLHIDLAERSVTSFSLPDEVLDRYVGGKGIGAYLLAQHQDPAAPPFAPENALIFVVGPLTGTQGPSMRSLAVFQSPVTRLFTDSHFGGFWGQELKSAGYDGLLITGAAVEPVYVEIDNREVAIKPAADLWGLDTFDTYERLRPQYPAKDWCIACVGPAGENRVAFASIDMDWHRQAGRGGGGAVMGAKNLKAIVVRGTGKAELADPEAYKAAVRATQATMKDHPSIVGFRDGGTAASIPWAQAEGLLPTRNFQRGSFEGSDGLGDEAQRTKFWLKNISCSSCPIACTKEIVIPADGPLGGAHDGEKADSLEYESAAMLGANLEIGDTKEAVCLGLTCDVLGMDTISAGAVLSFACEAADRGLLELNTTWGDGHGLALLLEDIAYRRGVGELLAEGVREAAKRLGQDAEKYAIHVKGLELPAWGPRGAPGMGLAYMTGDRGGCHQRAFPILYEVGGESWRGQSYERLAVNGKAQLLAELQNKLAGFDTFTTCDFARYGISEEQYLEMFAAATGRNLGVEELYAMGERIWNLTRLFNLKAGMRKEDEDLPARFKEEPLSDGPAAGHFFTESDIECLRADYYAARGWDEHGVPRPETLARLNVEYPALVTA
jgi:aldehyde:ferredoxin oxidoreductase